MVEKILGPRKGEEEVFKYESAIFDLEVKLANADKAIKAKDARIAELEDVVNKLWRRQDSLDTFNSAVNAILTPLFKKQGEQNDD